MTCAAPRPPNADLEQLERRQSEDLYYRLNVIRIHVPPLRDRREEIPHLSTYFLREASERLGKPDIHLSSAALDAFSQYWWPGNVRQLKNEIQRAVAMSAPGGTIEGADLSPEISAMRLRNRHLVPASGRASQSAAAVERWNEIYPGGSRRTAATSLNRADVGLTRRGRT